MGQASGIMDVGAPLWGHLAKSVAGGTDVTLTQSEYENRILRFTGTLTGNINVIVPLADGLEWLVVNGTAGAFTLTVKGSTGTGVAVTQGASAYVRADGTNIARCTPDLPGTLTAFTQTHSTADATLAAQTAAALTDSSGGTPGDTIAAAGGSYDQTNENTFRSSIVDDYNKLRTDHLDLAAFVNSLVDALQAQKIIG